MNLDKCKSLVICAQKYLELKCENSICKDTFDLFSYDAANYILKNAKDTIYSSIEGELAEKLNKAMKTLTHVAGVNVKDARRRIADKLIADNVYKF